MLHVLQILATLQLENVSSLLSFVQQQILAILNLVDKMVNVILIQYSAQIIIFVQISYATPQPVNVCSLQKAAIRPIFAHRNLVHSQMDIVFQHQDFVMTTTCVLLI